MKKKEVTNNPSCTEDGGVYTVCSICGKELEHTPLYCTWHKWSDWVAAEQPCGACTICQRYCAVCDISETVSDDKVIGHNWQKWVELISPTCAEYGVQERICGACGKKKMM